MSPREAKRLLSAALAVRIVAPPLLPRRPWDGDSAAALIPLIQDPLLPLMLRLAAAVIADRTDDAIVLPTITGEERHWQAIALRRSGRFAEARRCFRELGDRAIYPDLFDRSRAVLGFGQSGFRWAATTLALLTARGAWDPVWFVDACAAVDAGVLSRETAALLEEIQRAELDLLLLAGAAG